MRCVVPFFCGLLMAAAHAQSLPQTPRATPRVNGSFEGARVAVFETPQQSCIPDDIPDDIPDAMARAFRDSTGTIHFTTASADLYASLGPTLDTLQHSCDAAFHSANDGNPADFNDEVWIDSYFTFDGKKIAGLSHTEYHGWSFPGECHSQNYGLCEYDSDTFHISYNGGYRFDTSKGPANFVAGFPYKYEVDHGPMGYSVDSNIIAWGGWYYAMVTDYAWPPGCSGQTGPGRCLVQDGGSPMRTQNVFDPSSWRGWSGTGFTVSFADPYPGPVVHPQDHVYAPVPYMTFVTGINVYQPANVVVATLFNGYTNQYGPRGLYFSTSTDLVNWTKPTLVITLAAMLAAEPEGNWQYAYFSLIDPDASDLNFANVGDHPYLYYVRLDNNNSPLGRTVFRQPIALSSKP